MVDFQAQVKDFKAQAESMDWGGPGSTLAVKMQDGVKPKLFICLVPGFGLLLALFELKCPKIW